MSNITAWAEEPPVTRGAAQGRRKWAPIAKELAESPGKWGRIADGLSQTQAFNLATTIRHGRNAAFKECGSFDVSVNRKSDKTYEVWASFVA